MTILVEMIHPGHGKIKFISEDHVNANVYWLYRHLHQKTISRTITMINLKLTYRINSLIPLTT